MKNTLTAVLIPGLLSDSRVWNPLASALDDSVQIHEVDSSSGNSLAEIAALTLSQTEGKLLPIGHSMGGRIALEIVRQAPNRVRGLILADTGYLPLGDGEMEKRKKVIEMGYRSMEELADSWLPPMVHPERIHDAELMGELRQMVLGFQPEVHERQVRALIDRPDAQGLIAQIQCPTLLLAGRQDSWSPVEQHEVMASMIPDSSIGIIENAGHFAPIEKPEQVRAAVFEWLKDHPEICAGQIR